MSDREGRFRLAYDALLEQMPDPPAFDEITILEPRSTLAIRFSAWQVALGAAVVAVVLIGGIAVLLQPESVPGAGGPLVSPGATGTTAAPVNPSGETQTGFLFGRPLPWTLVFDNGYDKVKAFDVNDGIPFVSAVPGGAAGGQPYRLTEVDGRLIVGIGEIYAYDPATSESALLGEATIYVPAVEDDRVWLIDYGEYIGANPATVWQVSVRGEQLTEPVTLAVEGFPVLGVPGGLAVETEHGIAIWDLDEEQVVRTLGSGSARVADTSPDGLIAWCDDECNLHVTDLRNGDDQIVEIPEGEQYFRAGLAKFSSDDRFLAAPTSSGVVVADLVTGESWLAIDLTEDYFYFVNWAPNGHDLFASRYSYGQRAMKVAHHDVLSRKTALVDLPFGGTLDFVVVPTRDAGAFLSSENFVCPVTIPTQSGFIPPDLYPAYFPNALQPFVWSTGNDFWYGTEDLWTVLPLRPEEYVRRGGTWWSINLDSPELEIPPNMTVTWRRLDQDAPIIRADGGGTGGLPETGSFMLTDLDPREPGCWAVTASYKGSTLTYVYDNR